MVLKGTADRRVEKAKDWRPYVSDSRINRCSSRGYRHDRLLIAL